MNPEQILLLERPCVFFKTVSYLCQSARFGRHNFLSRTMLHIKIFSFNPLQEKCSLAWDDTGECAIIDPGFADKAEKDRLYGFIAEKGLKPVMILLTHGHFDHTLGLKQCAGDWNIPVLMHPADKEILKDNGFFRKMFGMDIPDVDVETEDMADGDEIRFGDTVLEVLHTPGHTPGGVCLLDRKDKVLFSGDTLFAGSIGRTDAPGGDYDMLMESIFGKLMSLDGDIDVVPGHGPTTNIAEERMKNPFLQPFNLPIEDEENGDNAGQDDIDTTEDR